MREIFVSILPEFPKVPDNFRTLLKMFRRLMNIAEDSRIPDYFRRLPNVTLRSSNSRRDLVSLLFVSLKLKSIFQFNF